jgi:hypothetical protein
MEDRTMRRRVLVVSLLAVFALLLTNCTVFFFTAPERRDAVEVAFSTPPSLSGVKKGATWDDVLHRLDSFEEIDAAVKGYEAVKKADETPGVEVASFIHISDAQIRDARAFHESLATLFNDFVVDVTIRRPFMEQFDDLLLSAHLSAYGKSLPELPGSGPRPFLVHTGDLLDISLASELMTAIRILESAQRRYAARGARIFSAGGNHDGLAFGNIRDLRSDNWSLGVNKTEFVLAHVAGEDPLPARPTAGFGFGGNEVLRSVLERGLSCKRQLGPDEDGSYASEWLERAELWCRHIRRSRKRWRRAAKDPIVGDSAAPSAYRWALHVSGFGDNVGARAGYYSWVDPPSPGGAAPLNIRYVVLDTRSKEWSEGYFDLVQAGWLYNQLRRAHERGEVVVVFGHHALDRMRSSEDPIYKPRGMAERLRVRRTGPRILRRLLDEAPHVTGYFYGHGHQNSEDRLGRMALIQTGSVLDWPAVARRVRVHLEPGDRCDPRVAKAANAGCMGFGWEFLRPEGGDPEEGGAFLDTVLYATRKDSEKEFRRTRYRKIVHPATGGLVAKQYDMDDDAWEKEHLKPDHMTVPFTFRDDFPEADTLFGRLLPEVNEKRCRLGLPNVRGTQARPYLPEASGVVVRLEGELAVVAGDESARNLWAFETADPHYVWALPLPELSLDDLEALAPDPSDERSLYAITSQALTKNKRKSKEARNRLARITLREDGTGIEEVRHYDGLRGHLIAHLERTLGGELADRRALREESPLAGGLNVEGAAAFDGGLLLGLREPRLADGRAIVVPLLDPEALVRGTSAAPRLGAPLLVRVPDGQAIRGMSEVRDAILLLLGPTSAGEAADAPAQGFQLARWKPGTEETRVLDVGLSGFGKPEGIAAVGDGLLAVDDSETPCEQDVVARVTLPDL